MRLFKGSSPFYAGFGNRITDAISYRQVDVPSSRIFTIDPTGKILLQLLSGFDSSYIKLNDIVDQIFPPILDKSTNQQFNDFNYWRPTYADIELNEILVTDSHNNGASDGDYEDSEDEFAEFAEVEEMLEVPATQF